MINDTLVQWHEEGRHHIDRNIRLFYELVEKARAYERQSDNVQAAVYCEMAALHAVTSHCGLFASPELERILIAIGKSVIRAGDCPEAKSEFPSYGKRILHVCTTLMPIGGHSVM